MRLPDGWESFDIYSTFHRKVVGVVEFHIRSVLVAANSATRTYVVLGGETPIHLGWLPLRNPQRDEIVKEGCIIFTQEEVVDGVRVIHAAGVVLGLIQGANTPVRLIALPTFPVQLSARGVRDQVRSKVVAVIDSR